jgi:hypothetical protein
MKDFLNQHETHGNMELSGMINHAIEQLQLPFVPGRLFFVVPTDDPMSLEFRKRFQARYADGAEVIQTDLATAYGLLTSNRNDTLVLAGNGTHTLTAMLDVSKSRTAKSIWL